MELDELGDVLSWWIILIRAIIAAFSDVLQSFAEIVKAARDLLEAFKKMIMWNPLVVRGFYT